jgi:hypothetical protein
VTSQPAGGFLSQVSDAIGKRILGSLSSIDAQAWELYKKSLDPKPVTDQSLGQTRSHLLQTGINNVTLQGLQNNERLRTMGAGSELEGRGVMIDQNTDAATRLIGAKSSTEAARAGERRALLGDFLRHEASMAGGSDAERLREVMAFAGSQDDKNRTLQEKVLAQRGSENTMNMIANLALTAASIFA